VENHDLKENVVADQLLNLLIEIDVKINKKTSLFAELNVFDVVLENIDVDDASE